MDIVRIFTGDDGRSHFEDLDVALEDFGMRGQISERWPARGVQFRTVSGEYELDFHNAPRRQLVVNLTGSVEIELGDGTKRVFGPGTIFLAEDTPRSWLVITVAVFLGMVVLFSYLEYPMSATWPAFVGVFLLAMCALAIVRGLPNDSPLPLTHSDVEIWGAILLACLYLAWGAIAGRRATAYT